MVCTTQWNVGASITNQRDDLVMVGHYKIGYQKNITLYKLYLAMRMGFKICDQSYTNPVQLILNN